MKKYCILLVATALVATSPTRLSGADQPSASAADQMEVTETIRSMFAAMAVADVAKFRAVTAPGFYAFDVGKRFTGDALLDLVKTAHAAGNAYVWTVKEPDVHIHGETAWITYVNRGSVKDAAGTKNVTWLESAVLRKEKERWRIHFFHSTRAPEEKAEGT